MGLIIDTCVFIKQEKGQAQFDFSISDLTEEVYMSAMTVSELLVGVHRADSEERKLKRSVFVETIIARIPVLSFTAEVARIHAELLVYFFKNGNVIGAHDLIIAATALFYDCALLTTNIDEFERVPGLKIHGL